MKITILCENTVGRLIGYGEHGFSVFIETDMEESIKSLKRTNIEKIGVSHCTGMRATSRLHQEFGDRFFQGCVGSVLEV